MLHRRGAGLRAAAIAGLLALAACGGGTPRGPVMGAAALREPVSCVPYARARSGINLTGDAGDWWQQAAGVYPRGHRPQPGSVLVISPTGRMRSGHVSVVTRVVSSREIRVDHANWAGRGAKGQITRDQPVRDVSPGNDWSQVQVWYPPVSNYGVTTYAAAGFVHGRSQVAEW